MIWTAYRAVHPIFNKYFYRVDIASVAKYSETGPVMQLQFQCAYLAANSHI